MGHRWNKMDRELVIVEEGHWVHGAINTILSKCVYALNFP